jgi:hypothetical protein
MPTRTEVNGFSVDQVIRVLKQTFHAATKTGGKMILQVEQLGGAVFFAELGPSIMASAPTPAKLPVHMRVRASGQHSTKAEKGGKYGCEWGCGFQDDSFDLVANHESTCAMRDGQQATASAGMSVGGTVMMPPEGFRGTTLMQRVNSTFTLVSWLYETQGQTSILGRPKDFCLSI